MNKPDISQARNPDLRASLAALQRAAEMARQTAIQTNTAIVLVQDSKLVKITAQQLREMERLEESLELYTRMMIRQGKKETP